MMESLENDIQLLVKCGGVQVQLPSQIIKQESTVLWKKLFSNNSCLNDDPKLENKDIKLLDTSQGKENAVKSFEEKLFVKDQEDNENQKLKGVNYVDNNTGNLKVDDNKAVLGDLNKKRKITQRATDNRETPFKSRREEVIVEIQGYQSEAVEKVFQYLSGNKKALECVNVIEPNQEEIINNKISTFETNDKIIPDPSNISIAEVGESIMSKTNKNLGISSRQLSTGYSTKIFKPLRLYADMLKLCSEYDIGTPVPEITEYLKKTEICVDNLVEGLEAAETISMYADLSEELFERCVKVARSNLTNNQVLISFLLNNKDKLSIIEKMIDELMGEFSNSIIRFNVLSSSNEQIKWDSPTYIINNFEWNITVRDQSGAITRNGKRNLVFSVNCYSTDNPGWFCETTLELKVTNTQNEEEFCLNKTLSHRFSGGSNTHSYAVDNEQQIQNILQGGCFTIEIELTIENSDGNCKFSDETEKKDCKNLWYKPIDDIAMEDWEMPENDTWYTYEGPILLVCSNMSMVVPKDVLIRESKWFNAFFNWERNEKKTAKTKSKKKRKCKIKSSYQTLRKFNIDDSYNCQAVKILFENLQNQYALLTECTDIALLSDMVRLCDFYMIKTSRNHIIQKMFDAEIDILCLTESVEALNKLGELELYRNLADNLLAKCYHLAMANISSRQVVMTYLSSNHLRLDVYAQILEMLGGNHVSELRFEFNFWEIVELESRADEYERAKKRKRSNLYDWELNCSEKEEPDREEKTIFMMANNMTWRLGVSIQNNTEDSNRSLGISLTCEPPSDASQDFKKDWTCATKFELRLYKVCREEYFSKEYETIFSNEVSYFQDKQFCHWENEFWGEGKTKYVQDETYNIEVVLKEVKKSENIFPNVSEHLIR